MSDLISRQAVLDILDDMVKDYTNENNFDKAQGVAWVKVQRLPSVRPHQKDGSWKVTKTGCGHDKKYVEKIKKEHGDNMNVFKGVQCECSLCGFKYVIGYIDEESVESSMFNHCPNCSAYMEGV